MKTIEHFLSFLQLSDLTNDDTLFILAALHVTPQTVNQSPHSLTRFLITIQHTVTFSLNCKILLQHLKSERKDHTKGPKSGSCSEVIYVKIVQNGGRHRQVVAIQRWSSAQV